MFKNKGLPTRVYSYAAAEPTVNYDLVLDIMAKGHRYRNALVEIELTRRKRVNEALSKFAPGLKEVEDELEKLETKDEDDKKVGLIPDAEAARRALNSKARSRKVEAPELDAKIKELKARRRALWAQRKEMRDKLFRVKEWSGEFGPISVWAKENKIKQYDPAYQKRVRDLSVKLRPELAEIDSRVAALAREDAKRNKKEIEKLKTKRNKIFKTLTHSVEWRGLQADIEDRAQEAKEQARVEIGFSKGSWGTYNAIANSMDKTRKGAPPRFKRWDGRGRVVAQIQAKPDDEGGKSKSLLVADVFKGEHKQLQIELSALRPSPTSPTGRLGYEGVWVPGTRRPKRLGDGIVRIRIDSNERRPVFCEIPIHFTRPLPPDAQIKSATIVRRRCGTSFKWWVQLALSLDDSVNPNPWQKDDLASEGVVGVDVGWRIMHDGVVLPEGFFGSKGDPKKRTLTPDEAAWLDRELARWAASKNPIRIAATVARSLLAKHLKDPFAPNQRIGDLRNAVGMVEKGRLRIGVWYGSDGGEGEICLSPSWVQGMRKTESIRSIRDKNMNEVRDALDEWLRARKASLPEWLLFAVGYKHPSAPEEKPVDENARKERRPKIKTALGQWRATNQFAKLVLDWRQAREQRDKFAPVPGEDEVCDRLVRWWRENCREATPDGTPSVFEVLEAWRRRDKHLYQYEAHLRDQLLTSRRELFRVTSAMLRRRYVEVRVEGRPNEKEDEADARKHERPIDEQGEEDELENEDEAHEEPKAKRVTRPAMPLPPFHRTPGPEAPPGSLGEKGSPAKEYIRYACVSSLRERLKEVVKTYLAVPAPGTTQVHHFCGKSDEWDQAELYHTCSHCGQTFDQDYNAAMNICTAAQADPIPRDVVEEEVEV